MRNLKKFLALVLAMLMIFSVAMITTSAADKADYTDPANHLAGLKIMKGDENGNLMLDNGVTRYQAALFFVQALTGKTDVETWNAEKKSAYFTDVNEYGTAIDYAYGIKLILGRGNGVYGYNDPITYQDLLVMAVRALGYETEDMQYPYGYILAADKLDLTDDVDLANFKADLKRGEVAQIIWNMLNTQVAETDPLSDKILYPDEKGLTENLNSEFKIERETLLEKAGYASGELLIEVLAFNEADEDDEDEIDTVTVAAFKADDFKLVDSKMEIAAADLGIDLETARQIDYCGKLINALIDCAEEDFDDKYSTDADEAEASIVSATPVALTHVENIAAANIKFDADKNTLTLGGEKFKTDDADVEISFATFDPKDGIWTITESIDAKTFTYTTKDGYTGTDNTYYAADYDVIDYTVTKDKKDVDKTLVTVYLTPVFFAQFVEREIEYSVTSKDEKFTLVAELSDTKKTNLDGEESFWVERTVSGKEVTESTKKLTKSQGEKSLEVTVEGVEVKSGDFFFGSYNGVDNVLTAYKNVGRFETGRLTAKNNSKETVKIGGTNYEFGFEDVFGFEGMATYDDDAYGEWIADLEKGEDNVKYLLCDGKIVYIEKYNGTSADSDSYPFVLISTNPKDVADVLDITDSKYEDNLTGEAEGYPGWYIADNGYVAVAVMNTETGKLELGYIKGIAYDYDDKDDEFDKTYDLANLAKYTDLMGDGYTKFDDYTDASDLLSGSTIFAVVEEKDGVYTVADIEQDDGQFNGYIVDSYATAPLTFTDSSSKTNAIKAVSDEDVDAARVTLNADTIIVAFDGNGNLMARKGIQAKKYSLTDCVFFAAGSDLIVVYTGENLAETDALGGKWSNGTASTESALYLVLGDEGCEYEVDDDGMFTLTAYNLFNAATLEKVESIVMTGDTEDKGDVKAKDDALKAVKMGKIVKFEDGKITASDVAEILTLDAYEDYEAINLVDGDFDFDEDTFDAYNLFTGKLIGSADKREVGDALSKINVKVATFNLTGLDEDDWDFDDYALDVEYGTKDFDFDEIEVDGESKYAYALTIDAKEPVEEISEPTDGILTNDIVASEDYIILIHDADHDFDDKDVELKTVEVNFNGLAKYNKSNNTMDVVIFKTLEKKTVSSFDTLPN